MTILVIGSEGNVGSKLVPYLKGCGYTVFSADIQPGYRHGFTVVDIKYPADLFMLFDKHKPQVVFNLAAVFGRMVCEESPSLAIETNVTGAHNVAMACKMVDAKMINFSTSEVYGDIGGVLSELRTGLSPNNIYGLSKLMGEKVIGYEAANGLDAVTVRPSMLYHEDETRGDHRSAMIRFADNLLNGKKISVYKGSTRSWLHIDDAVKILEQYMYIDEYTIVNLTHPFVIEISEIAKRMCEILHLDYDKYVIEEPLPEKMTMHKKLCVDRQLTYSNIMPSIDIMEGVERVIKKLTNYKSK